MAQAKITPLRARDVANQIAAEANQLSPTNQRAVLSLLRRLRDRLEQDRNGEVDITLFIKSGSIAQNYAFQDTERVSF